MILEPSTDPVPLLCAVNLDSVESVPVDVLADRLGRLSDERMREVCAALSAPKSDANHRRLPLSRRSGAGHSAAACSGLFAIAPRERSIHLFG